MTVVAAAAVEEEEEEEENRKELLDWQTPQMELADSRRHHQQMGPDMVVEDPDSWVVNMHKIGWRWHQSDSSRRSL
jgi:hypothetical protein